ncbi:MAG: cation:proton antiporter [Planctomycetes bacterium]|nr:cation:proton antiporter [Planctomycetota bacterium]
MPNAEPIVLLTILTMGAAGFVWLMSRWRISPILAYITLGVLIAPFKDWLFADAGSAQAVAEFGVVLLMFFIGIEFRLGDARAMLMVCMVGGGLQVLLTAIVAGGLALPLGASFGQALTVGFMVAMSSTVLVMKALEDRREGDTHRARLFLTVSLFQDIAAIFVVALLPIAARLLSTDSAEPQPGSNLHAQLALLFVGLPMTFAGFRYILPRWFEKAAMTRFPEAFSLASLGACLCVALTAKFSGASMALGAFLGGLVLAQTPFTSQIMADLSTLRNLALGFFFVSVGMLVNLPFIATHLLPLGGAFIAVVVLKTLLAMLALKVAGVPLGLAAGVALPLAQVGEFSFVLGQEGARHNLLEPELQHFILALSVLTMLSAPFLAAWSGRFSAWAGGIFDRINAKLGKSRQADQTDHRKEPTEARAVVVGYGPAGQTVARILHDFKIFPTVVDLNPKTVEALRKQGTRALYGDAGRREVLEAAGVRVARFLVVTLPDTPGRLAVIAQARAMNPDVRILTRARYLQERAFLEEAGAQNISFEEGEVAVRLARALLTELGVDIEAIRREEDRIRGEIGG